MNRTAILFGVLFSLGLGIGGVSAQTLLEPRTAQVANTGFYVRGDGTYQSIRLPRNEFGAFNITPAAPFGSLGPAYNAEQNLNGYGFSGAIGMRLSSKIRAEVGASSLKAQGTGTGSYFGNASVQYTTLGRTFTANIAGGPGAEHTTSSSLRSDVSAWSVNGKLMMDFDIGTVTVTPSLSMFGGRSRVDQSFADTTDYPFFAAVFYSANSSLRWNDVGVKAGLQASAPLSNWLIVTAGGSLGFASRNASMSATDTLDNTGPFFGLAGASAVMDSRRTIPFIGNIEVGLTAAASSMIAVRAFAGLNYDSRMPGIQTGFVDAFSPVGRATIKFEGETSFYAGGGVVISFHP